MKECSGKRVQKVKVSQNDPLGSSSQKIDRWTARSRTWGSSTCSKRTLTFRRRIVRYQELWWRARARTLGSPTRSTFRRRVAKYHRVSMRCPKVFHSKLKYFREYMRGVQVRVQRRCPNPTPLRDPYSIKGTYFCVSQVRA